MKKPTKTLRSQAGATMLEVVLGLTVTSVLTTAAVPSFDNLMRSRHLVPTTSELVAAMTLARSEAITRGARVVVASHGGTDWSQGWQIFVDANNNGVHDSGEQVLRDAHPAATGLSITPHFGATYSGAVLSYESTGRLGRPGGHGLVIGRLTLTQGGETRSLCFASVRLRVAKSTTCS